MTVSQALVRSGTNGASHENGLRPVSLESIGALITDKTHVLWLDVEGPTPEDVQFLRQEFGFHELTLEDLLRRRQRPKIEQYPTYFFIVFFALGPDRREELGILVGDNYLVTVHQEPSPEIAETVDRWTENAERLDHGVAVPLYSLLDAVVDGYFPVVDSIAERIEVIESGIFSQAAGNYVPEVLALKRELLDLRRLIAHERDVANVLIRRDLPLLGDASLLYFQDIYDHLIRVVDAVDLYRDQLTGVLDAHLSVVSNRLNSVMKRMGALATILMSVNLIASNYGMNFSHMPELGWEYGYFFTVGLMAAVALVLFLVFRRSGWL